MDVENYIKERFPLHFDINFDKTFSMRNYVEIINILSSYYKKSLPHLFERKKVLHIGSGKGYLIDFINSCGGNCIGVDPYVPHKDSIKKKIEDTDLKEKFDIIIAQDVFVKSIFFSDLMTTMNKLQEILQEIMIIDNNKEEDLLKNLSSTSKNIYDERIIHTFCR
ncbi:methyltransferase domain-containing protein [Nanoarchaeota archaeon]